MTRTSLFKAGVTTLAALGLAAAMPAHAQTTLTGYNFNDTNAVDSNGNPTPVATSGINASGSTITFTGFTNKPTVNGTSNPATAVSYSGGTSGATGDNALRFNIGNGSNLNNNGALVGSVSTTGYQSLVLQYDTSASSTSAFQTQIIEVSTDGTNFTTVMTLSPVPAVPTVTKPATGPIETTETFNLPASFSNLGTAYYEIVFSGAPSPYGGTGSPNDRVDNLSISGTAIAAAPEPSGVVALAIGAGVLGLMVARRRNVAA